MIKLSSIFSIPPCTTLQDLISQDLSVRVSDVYVNLYRPDGSLYASNEPYVPLDVLSRSMHISPDTFEMIRDAYESAMSNEIINICNLYYDPHY